MEGVIHANQIIHSGAETPHYTAQEAQFFGGKEVVKLARWHRVKPRRSKCFICVLAETSVCHYQSGGVGGGGKDNLRQNSDAQRGQKYHTARKL